jgi:uncharacterized membrane protein
VTTSEPGAASDASEVRLERSIGRLLTAGSYAAIALLAGAFVLMLVNGVGPLSGGPAFDIGALPGDLLALRPTGLAWLGLIVVLATPASRVVASLVGYRRRGETRMALVAILILLVILLSVVVAIALEG